MYEGVMMVLSNLCQHLFLILDNIALLLRITMISCPKAYYKKLMLILSLIYGVQDLWLYNKCYMNVIHSSQRIYTQKIIENILQRSNEILID